MRNRNNSFDVSIKAIVLWGLMCAWYVFTFVGKNMGKLSKQEMLMSFFTPKKMMLGVVMFATVFVCMYIYSKHEERINDFLYRYRYAIALIILIVGVSLRVSGSSIGMWGQYIGQSENDNVLLGVSRAIRSDEYGALTPLAFSQAQSTLFYPYFNDIPRGTLTDMYIVYGQPVWDFTVLFRPQHWGYLLLGLDHGMSYYWVFRFLLLFMAIFELGNIVTNKNKKLSVFIALLVVFSPVTQWWFAVNSVAEILAFGAYGVVCIYKYMRTKSYRVRMFMTVLLAWIIIVYALSFYPAWQVPMAYVYVGMALYFLVSKENRKSIDLKKDGSLLALLVLIVVAGLLVVYQKSSETIQTVLNTAYPGKRVDSGGGLGSWLFDYPLSMFYGFTGVRSEREMDILFDFFPISNLVGLYVMYKRRDILLSIMNGISVFLFVYITFGFPSFFAKLTLMSYTTPVRVLLSFGIVNLFILARSMDIYTITINTVVKKAVLFLGVGAVVCVSVYQKSEYIKWMVSSYLSNQGILAIILILCVYLLLVYICICLFSNKHKNLIASISIMLFGTGLIVNPLRSGIDVIYKNDLVENIKHINTMDSGKWIVDTVDYPIINAPILAGASTINSTNVYPNLEIWRSLDLTGEYDDIYNRYAHVSVDIVDTEKTIFELPVADNIVVKLPHKFLKKLDVKYVLTNRDLTIFNTNEYQFELMGTYNGFHIFRIK